jgi:hypothetical protein
MKSVLLYFVALYVAATHADVIGQVIARVIDFATAHAPALLR